MRLFWLIFLPAAGYQALSITAGLLHLRRRAKERRSRRDFRPGVSVLKPVRGLDPNTREAFLSQIQQDYPEFEILFGAENENDPAAEEIRRLKALSPEAPVRLIYGSMPARNGKVGVLMKLARQARFAIWVINDSDIRVGPTYLSEIVAPLADPGVGVVTCPYRANAHTAATAWEALGIASDFIPSAVAAQLLGVREFGFGSTLAFRAADLARAGGFAAISDYLADDYQLAKHITSLGKRTVLSTYTVETSLGEASWAGVWQHQLRWARTIRASKGRGYIGLPVTQAGVWACVAVVCGAWQPAAMVLGLRLLSALVSTRFVLESKRLGARFWLAPAWDLYAFALWCASYAGRRVRWRDQVLAIGKDGRILS